MSDKDDKKVVSISDFKQDRMKIKGNYWGLVEEFEILRLKFVYEKELPKQDAIRFCELCKYMMANGHSESFKLSCKYLYDRYMGKYGL